MAFAVPTYSQIRERMLADVDASLAADGFVRGPVENAIVAAMAGASLLIHIAIARVARNKVPTKAEALVMRAWAAFFGITPKPATLNIGTATFTGTDGSTIPAGTSIRLRNGIEYTTDALGTVASGSVTVSITAVELGLAGRADPGAAIFLGGPIAGVTSQGVVGAGGISGGQDVESDASVLSRLVERLRNPPKGGTVADWIAWTKATPGVAVANAWVLPNVPPEQNGLGPSSVLILFTVTADNPIPLAGDITAVNGYIASFQPADLLALEARAPTAQPINPSIQLSPNDGTTQAAVTASLRAMLATDAEPGGTVLLSRINEAISTATGESDHVLLSPTANVTAADGQTLVTLGTITFSTL